MMNDGWMTGGNGGDVSIFGGILMMVFWVAIIVGIVLLVVWLVRQTAGGQMHGGHGGGTYHAPEESALDIVKARYARGEIDKTEFEEKKKDLTG
ncbi:MAG: SHOCT domain-containing protein [Thermoleophilia bacterium]